jgi:hypothetical protein
MKWPGLIALSLMAWVCVILHTQAQSYCDVKYDYVWVMGGIDDTIPHERYGGSEINYNTSPPGLNRNYKNIELPFQNASFASKDGELLFYSNGCEVFNALDEIMSNGNTLNPGEIYPYYCPYLGYSGRQNMIALPDPVSEHLILLFHIDKIFNRTPGAPFLIQSPNLYCTVIDMSLDDGLGAVIKKNQVIIHDTSMLGSPMTAVKHADGYRWWVLTPDRWSNGFHTVLVDEHEPLNKGIQYIGLATDPRAAGGQAKFSSDGNHFAWYHPWNGLFIYDFDRNEGLLSNFRHVVIPEMSTAITGGCEFSPSSRFVYVNHDTSLFQIDLQAADLQAGLTHIADYDGFRDPLPTSFFYMERTPDRRIIMNVLNGSQWLHVIQEPDKKGQACRFEQHALKLPTVNNFTLPHFPNYRLGALGEPLCDSIVSTTTPQEGRTNPALFPNPATTTVHIVADKPVRSCTVFNTAGRQMPLEWVEHSDRIILHVNRLPAGMYIVRIDYMDGFVTTDRFVITE